MLINLPQGWQNTIANWTMIDKDQVYWHDYEVTLTVHNEVTLEIDEKKTGVINAINAKINEKERQPKMQAFQVWLSGEYDNYAGLGFAQIKALYDQIEDPAVKAFVVIILMVLFVPLHRLFDRNGKLRANVPQSTFPRQK